MRIRQITPLLTVSCSLAFVTPMPAAAQIHTAANVDGGLIEGSVFGDVLSFKGIPYAAPPVGSYRWRAPQRVTRWTGVREAITFGHDCMQKPELGDAAKLRTVPAEDCLVLNVWRPASKASAEKLPVLVWIHGGGYCIGGSSPAVLDGSRFAQQGIVFVSFNYRLGRFGFFAHPALIAAKEGLVGNFALMDQIEALRWVKRNISAFGGDPKNVTLMGESAGGFSVLALLTSPKAEGLFQRAIVLSGGGRTFLLGGKKLTGGNSTDPSADQIGANFAENVGVKGDGPQALRALRALPAETMLGEPNPSTYVDGPIIDNSMVIAIPQVMLQRGEMARVPIMIGSTTRDLVAILPPSPENPLSYFGVNSDKARAIYNPDGKLDPNQVRSAIGEDMTMHEPARFVAKQMTKAGMPVWLYRFGYVAEAIRSQQTAALHASEVSFLFNTLDKSSDSEHVTEKDRGMAKNFSRYFVNFVKSGQPNSQGLPTWPKFDAARSEIMAFTSEKGPMAQPDPWKKRLDLVERAADTHADRR